MPNNIGIMGYDYVEFYVGSAKQVAYWFVNALGMDIEAYRGPETGFRRGASYYMSQNQLKIVVTSALNPDNYEVNSFVTLHGDGVKRWAARVENVPHAFNQALKNGAIPITPPRKLEDDQGVVEEAAIRIYDDTELVFIDRSGYQGIFKPGFEAACPGYEVRRGNPNLIKIDHIVGNVRINEMNLWEEYFNKTMGFETMLYFGPGDIATQYSALLSKVVRTPDFSIRNPINEPYEGLKVSQIEEFINEYNGTGVQHIALESDNIIESVSTLRQNGIEFLTIPPGYYDDLEKKIAAKPEPEKISEDFNRIRELAILCDYESTGYLLQIFTKPIGDRPTFFFEIIQRRKGAQGFGYGNFKALFEAIEREQERRGNLERR